MLALRPIVYVPNRKRMARLRSGCSLSSPAVPKVTIAREREMTALVRHRTDGMVADIR
jgi:hypothetical protein